MASVPGRSAGASGPGPCPSPDYWANADAQEWSEAQVQALTWPYFKPTTSKPVFSLYDALGRPDNLKIGGMFRSRIEGINNQFRPAPVASDDIFAAFRTNIFAEYDTGHKVKIGGGGVRQPRLFGEAELVGLHNGGERPRTQPGLSQLRSLRRNGRWLE